MVWPIIKKDIPVLSFHEYNQTYAIQQSDFSRMDQTLNKVIHFIVSPPSSVNRKKIIPFCALTISIGLDHFCHYCRPAQLKQAGRK